MGVSEVLAGRAGRRAHVLTVEAPGWWLARAQVERAAVARGWQLATSPADADVLAVCGPPGAGLAAAVERVWQQLPGPRARVDVAGTDLGAAETALTRAADLLRTTGATDTPADHVPPGQHDGHDSGTTRATTPATAPGTTRPCTVTWRRPASRLPRGPTTATAWRWTS